METQVICYTQEQMIIAFCAGAYLGIVLAIVLQHVAKWFSHINWHKKYKEKDTLCDHRDQLEIDFEEAASNKFSSKEKAISKAK
jgi:hypothetical protein